MVLPLKSGIIYGPVMSRRFGPSLGINVLPANKKVCSFDCVYCHYGRTMVHISDAAQCLCPWPSVAEIIDAVERAIRSELQFNLVTFSGHGEPTLHPDFPQLVSEVRKLRDRYRPQAKLALLSNSTGLLREEVERCVAAIDLPVFKLDSSLPDTFAAINRPAPGITHAALVEAMTDVKPLYVQTLLVDGQPCNADDQHIDAYCDLLLRLQPVEAQIYSIDRPVASSGIRLVEPARLEAIADIISRRTGVPVRAFHY